MRICSANVGRTVAADDLNEWVDLLAAYIEANGGGVDFFCLQELGDLHEDTTDSVKLVANRGHEIFTMRQTRGRVLWES